MTDRVAFRTTTPRPAAQGWRNNSDRYNQSYKKLPSAASLHPDDRVIESYADGQPVARAIIAAWCPCLAWQSLVVPA